MTSGDSPNGGGGRLLNRKSATLPGDLHRSVVDPLAAPALDPNLLGGGALNLITAPITFFIAALMAGDPITTRAVDDWIAGAEAPARLVA